MPISEIISLLELARNLANRKTQIDKEYFENFVEPLWDTFVKVHEDYKKSIDEYSEMLANKNIKISAIMEKIQKDSLFTSDLRAGLYTLIEHVPSPYSKSHLGYLSDFTNDIISYLTYRNIYEGKNTDDLWEREELSKKFPPVSPQHIRLPLLVYLLRKGEETNREQAQKTFLHVFHELQHLHWRVQDSYQSLRKQVLQ
jgi:hypothetical protein